MSGLLLKMLAMSYDKMIQIEDQIDQTFKDYVTTRKQYEEEMKKTYAMEKKITKLETKIRTLKSATKPITEVSDK